MSISEYIKNKFLSDGFIKIGYSKPEVSDEIKNYFRQWLDNGKNAGMQWLETSFEKRINPFLVMPDVKSIISLAYLYDTPFIHNDDKATPKISRYAFGKRDYHKIIKKKLKAICKEVESEHPGIITRIYVDDGPVMDKYWAVKSGIGWTGKHTNVLNKEFGSFFFIATILINAELEYDTPPEDLCGGCRLCINACPTGAIYSEYKLDANLCISYHTIENRGEIPDYITLNGWIFGCDICQDVCPYNKRKYFTENIDFYPIVEIFNKPASDLKKIPEEKFNNIFSSSPVKRTRYKGFKRNVEKVISDFN